MISRRSILKSLAGLSLVGFVVRKNPAEATGLTVENIHKLIESLAYEYDWSKEITSSTNPQHHCKPKSGFKLYLNRVSVETEFKITRCRTGNDGWIEYYEYVDGKPVADWTPGNEHIKRLTIRGCVLVTHSTDSGLH